MLAGLIAVSAAGAFFAGPAAASMDLNASFTRSPRQAGGHPDAEISFVVTSASGEKLKSVGFGLGQGFTFEPASVSSCVVSLAYSGCPPDAQVGIVTVRGKYEGDPNHLLGTAPLYNMMPVANEFARLRFTIPMIEEPVEVAAWLQTAPEEPAQLPYQLRLSFDQLPQASPLSRVDMSIWGVPGDPSHDGDRFPSGSSGCPESETTSCNSKPAASTLAKDPFTLDAVDCNVNSLVALYTQVAYSTYEGFAHTFYNQEIGGACDPGFAPTLTVTLGTSAAYSSTSLRLDLKDPLPESPDTPDPSQIQSATVTTHGLALGPGLSGHPVCTTSQAELTTNDPSHCPESSKVGSVKLDVAGLPEPIQGGIFLAEPVGGAVRVLVIAVASGLEVKMIGTIETLPAEQLRFTFGAEPHLPIAEEDLKFAAGFVRTPVHCGNYLVDGSFVPWDGSLPTVEAHPEYSISTGPGGSGSVCIGAPTNVGLQLEPASIVADGKSQTVTTVAILDGAGNGVPAEDVQLRSSDRKQTIGPLVDNGDGTYSAVITSSTLVGAATITATDISATPALSGSTTLTQTEVPTTASAPPPSLPATLPSPPHAPVARFLTKPPRQGSKGRARFVFAADVPSARFTCRLDRARFRACSPPVVLRKLSPGWHVFSVRAAEGAVVGPATTWRFRVARPRR